MQPLIDLQLLSLLALGIYISYRVFDVADITVDGSITFGAAICAVLIVKGTQPLLATLAAFVGGLAAGAVTGILQAKFKLNPLLSGILVMTSLYSVNLHVMGSEVQAARRQHERQRRVVGAVITHHQRRMPDTAVAVGIQAQVTERRRVLAKLGNGGHGLV
jgi:ABC-type uncharacterized transport system permease subunit